jgi:hypothetical protein
MAHVVRRFGIPSHAGDPVAVFTSDRALKIHPAYVAATAGGPEAADLLVYHLLPPEALSAVRRRFGPNAIYTPVVAQERAGVNAIPYAMAEHLSASAGGRTTVEIVEVNRAFHTGAKAMERLIARAQFDGPVETGSRYVLVDDVTVMGSTLAELANHIQNLGAEVAGLALLVNASRTGPLSAAAARTQQIERRYGGAIREIFNIEPRSLTGPETEYILNFRDADALRNRAAAAHRERGERLRAQGRGRADEG